MNIRFSTGFLYLGFFTMMAAICPQAEATLGEGADSITKDRDALSAAKGAMTYRANYKVQALSSDATTVREYLTPDGIVFAVAWNGLVHPDLTTLLGSYAAEYQNAKRQLPRRHGKKSMQVRGERVVVETWGHMRNLQGRAYLPALVPEGVNVNEIH